MLIPINVLKVAKVASKDCDRPALRHLHVARKGFVCEATATDGKVFIHTTWRNEEEESFPSEAIELADRDSRCFCSVPLEVVTDFAKCKNAYPGKPILDNVHLSEYSNILTHTDLDTTKQTSFRPFEIDGSYPDYHRILEREKDISSQITINPVFLIKALKAIIDLHGKSEKELCVNIKFDKALKVLELDALLKQPEGKKTTAIVMGYVEKKNSETPLN